MCMGTTVCAPRLAVCRVRDSGCVKKAKRGRARSLAPGRESPRCYGVADAPNTSVGLPEPGLLACAKNTLNALPPWSRPS